MQHYCPRKIPIKEKESFQGQILYVGFDETNHRDELNDELIVAVFSPFEKDIQTRTLHRQRPKKKKRGGRIIRVYKNPLDDFGDQRKYTFLISPKSDRDEVPEDDFWGYAISSLLKEDLDDKYNRISLFVDGSIGYPKRKRIKDIVSEICEIDCKKIKLRAGKNADTRYPLVNRADHLAYWLFYDHTLPQLSCMEQRRFLIKP